MNATATSGMQINQVQISEGSKLPTDIDVTNTLSTEQINELLLQSESEKEWPSRSNEMVDSGCYSADTYGSMVNGASLMDPCGPTLMKYQSTVPFGRENTANLSPQLSYISVPPGRSQPTVDGGASGPAPITTTSGMDKPQESEKEWPSRSNEMVDSDCYSAGSMHDFQEFVSNFVAQLSENSGQVGVNFPNDAKSPSEIPDTYGSMVTGASLMDPCGPTLMKEQSTVPFGRENTANLSPQLSYISVPPGNSQPTVDGGASGSAPVATTSGMDKPQEPHQHQNPSMCPTDMKRKVDGSYSAEGKNKKHLSENHFQTQHLPQNTTGQQNPEVVIYPEEGSVEGGRSFHLEFHSGLPAELRSGWARFGNSSPVKLSRFANDNILFGLAIPSASGKKPGVVCVIVTTDEGGFLGDTLFTYVDPQEKEKENWKNFMCDPNKMGRFLKMYGKMVGKQEKKVSKTIRLSGDSRDRSMQSQEMLPAFVDVALLIEDKQFIEELPSPSAQRTRCERYIPQLLEDPTDDGYHGDEKCDLHEINKRFTQKSDTGPTDAKEIKRSDLSKSIEVDKAEPRESPCSWTPGETLGIGEFGEAFEDPEFEPNAPLSWTRGEFVVAGSFGKVYKCHFGYNQILAVKIVQMEPQTQQVEALNNEIRILKKLRHQRIVSYYGSGQRDGQLHLFMEFMAGGSLCDQIKRNGVLPEHLSKRYTKQMLEGVNFLHSRDIIHRDIKGANVLLDIEGLNVKLADFGLSKMIENVGSKTNLATCCGTSYWLAPEILWGQGYGRKADIWSLGCTVVEMLTGKPPLGHLEPPAAMFRIGFKPLNLTLPESVSNEAKRFIEAALTWKPEKRPWSHELQSYTFISKRTEMEEISLDLKAASHPGQHMGATASSSIQKTCPDEDAGAGALPQTQETGLGQHMSATSSSLMQETPGDDTPLPIPETSAGALRHFSQLPQTIPHFVSRVQECSDISRYLCPEHNCRCVLLHGVTGVGKTSTAIKVANDRLNSDGRTVVVYVNCRYIDSLDDFANKVLQQVYHYPVEDPISELKNRLKSQDDYTVLLLDNFEFLLHLGDIGPDTPHEGAMAQEKTTLPTEGTKIKNFITEIVEISRKVKLLVTSSERIVFPSLGQEDVHLACFTPEESCQLLQKICKERVENQLQCAYQLSEICSGIPLVLYTLALSHSDLLSLVERMSCSPPQGTFEFLIKIQLVPEEEKINKCLDICFGRLSAQEKNTLLTLALLRGRFTLPRAEQIFQSLMPRENQLTVNALELAKRSLLEHIIVAGVCVYTFLRVIRDYCRKMESDQSGFREVFVNARNVFIDHFFAFLTDTFRLFLSKHASDAITAFRQEEENIMQLVEWCDNGKMTVVQIRKCIDVFNSAGELLAKMIGKEKYESVFTSLRKKSEEMGDQKRLSECLTSLGIKQVFHCSCAPGLCYVAAERAKEYLVEADRIQSSPDLSVNTGNSRAQCLSKLGRCLAKEGKFREGREKIQQAIDIRRMHGEKDIVMLAATYNDMAVALSLEGDHQEAIDIRERRTLPIYRERLGDHPFTATILNNLSNNFFTLGQYDNAKQYSDEALRMRLELLKDHRDTAKSLFDLGMVHKESGELQQAKEYLERCKTMQEKVLDDNIKDLQRTRNEIEEVCNRLARQQLE